MSFSNAINIDSVSHRCKPYASHTACGALIAGRSAGLVPATSVCQACIDVSMASVNERRWFPIPTRPAPTAAPIIPIIAQLHGELVAENRMLAREHKRPEPRPGVIASVSQRMTSLQDDRDRLLDAMLWHQQTWAHLADDCAICRNEVSFSC